MSAPAVIYLVLCVMNLIHAMRNDEFFATLFGTFLFVILLIWGGFFDDPNDKISKGECPTEVTYVVVPEGYHIEED